MLFLILSSVTEYDSFAFNPKVLGIFQPENKVKFNTKSILALGTKNAQHPKNAQGYMFFSPSTGKRCSQKTDLGTRFKICT